MDREELRDVIRDVIAEERAASMSRELKRERFTRYTDPEGKTWVSATLERGEMLRKVLLILAAIVGATVAAVQFTNTWFLMPTIDRRAQSLIQAHEVRVKAEMEATVPTFVTSSEFNAKVAERDERWRNQLDFNQRVEVTLISIQTDIKELLRRK